ncbi:hypothetical protein A9267_07490 [Shewanella sp. UCD-FRSSP16_17]|uniref:ketopantoate reductase family protein n=1 Tax=Shewanella sp. UCD-FRSSP16_17 TaxID=1853256 RepID=UPI0007EEC194|nr:2-dehydropantoate 2-reductase [Shewanella sp. UCD-FRSSP16_17]OBT08871.1 hypothetical protein A9267_07490 [Shewanella sp. UCD-FRSSP16_17]
MLQPHTTKTVAATKPTVAILGAGAIGMLVYKQLSEFTQPILLGRDLIKEHALTFEPFSKEATNETQIIEGVMCDVNTITHTQLASVSLIIVCVKSYQVTHAIRPLIDSLPQHCTLLLLHNGMGPHLDTLALLAQHQRDDINLYLGTTSQAALKCNKLHVRQTGTGKTMLGHLKGKKLTEKQLALLTQAIPDCHVSEDIRLALWQKLVINCAINPLTAIEQCRNGQLAKPQYQTRIDNIIDECIMVANADGVMLSKPAMVEYVYQVIALTANNYSSMHQDIAHQRQTEIHQINGYVTSRAKYHHIATPVNDQLVDDVSSL